ncbi:CBS domain-containing protein [Paenibacillus lycopersici]|uniref:CBS domain-containing protein n=1 Tax=Paenibacillus lycopersici TaxID=2704462 RepID=A0A6C0G1Q0_9BACL|nr:CBS domain-containing protein [Paenibacillus lycopersici]QHT61853.1 CBS domain-containing protein [Paenibacillus lycopersici]
MARSIKELMSTDCVTATLLDNVYELAVLMRDHDIGFVPIVDGKKLIGIVTDRDLVIRGYAAKHPGSTAVSEVMSSDIKAIDADTSVDEAAMMMSRNQIRRLPVVENGNLVGIVSIGDLAVRDKFADEAGEALSGISRQDADDTQQHAYH